MSDGLQEAISEMMSAMDDRMHLHMILQVDTVDEIYGRLGGADFYRAAIRVLERLRSKANALDLKEIAASHSARIAAAQSLLEKKLQIIPTPMTALDADSKPWYDPQTREVYTVAE